MTQKIYLGADHGGFELKESVKAYLEELDYEIEDLGTHSDTSVDYPEYGRRVGEAVVKDKKGLGIIICGSGIGISIAANKVAGVRCAMCNSIELATLGKEHNGANILAMGERTAFMDDPLDIVQAFLDTSVDKSERHERRRGALNCGCTKDR